MANAKFLPKEIKYKKYILSFISFSLLTGLVSSQRFINP